MRFPHHPELQALSDFEGGCYLDDNPYPDGTSEAVIWLEKMQEYLRIEELRNGTYGCDGQLEHEPDVFGERR